MPARRRAVYLHHRIATNVRALRHALGISQEELALRSGLHRTFVSAVERAERNISLATIEALAEGLDCEPEVLLQDPSR